MNEAWKAGSIALLCETLRPEAERVIAEKGIPYPVHYIESRLHEQPAKLHCALQEKMDALPACERILLSFGQCGNALIGVHAPVTMIFPRVEDCISLLIGSVKKRQALAASCPTYFLTQGWLAGERNLLAEYNYTLERYGAARGNALFSEMLKDYRRIGVLDTGAYDAASIPPLACPLCRALGLSCEILPATCDYIAQLLTGPWPEALFMTVPPHHTITEADLLLPV